MSYIDVVKKLIEKKVTISSAESITGGFISKMITDVPGSSSILKESFVTYSNVSKVNILGVDNKIIEKYGVVSDEVAIEMANGLSKLTGRDICVSTTGNAGPDICDDKPVGRVYIGIKVKDKEAISIKCDIPTQYDGTFENNLYNRNFVREEIAKKVFEEVEKIINIWH